MTRAAAALSAVKPAGTDVLPAPPAGAADALRAAPTTPGDASPVGFCATAVDAPPVCVAAGAAGRAVASDGAGAAPDAAGAATAVCV
mmetsp:Transcript_55180/g.98480  ORF Transcript_55180/g.98480 Transcript_55180/m.98480 type:complete len:87 (+) Transcript_55180:1544-1804(+)